jgi:hypothetical protein
VLHPDYGRLIFHEENAECVALNKQDDDRLETPTTMLDGSVPRKLLASPQ